MKRMIRIASSKSLSALLVFLFVACSGGSASDLEVDAAGEVSVDADTGPVDIQPTIDFPGTLSNWCRDQQENFSFFVTSMSAIWKLSDSVEDD